MMPRLVATDLDGTLLTPLGAVSDRTVAALTAAREAGITVVFATGRSHFSALRFVDGHDLADWLLCSNGATVWDPATAAVHRRLAVGDEVIEPLFDGVRSAFPEAAFAWETSDGFLWDPEWATLDTTSPSNPRRSDRVQRRGDLPTDVTKVLVGVPETPSAELVEPLTALAPAGVQVASSGAPFVEITHTDAHKGAALARLAAELGIESHETLAFGDNLNDLSMLEWAGHAVVMEHAPARVRALAAEIAPTNGDDGVARVLERILHP